MECGDTVTIDVTKKKDSYMSTLYVTWLRYLELTDAQIASGKIKLVVKADCIDNEHPILTIEKAVTPQRIRR